MDSVIKRFAKVLEDMRDQPSEDIAKALIDSIKEPPPEVLDWIYGCTSIQHWNDLIEYIQFDEPPPTG